MIELDRVTKQFDGRRDVTALRDLSLAIAKGEMVSIIGPSGSGKSTLLNLVGGLDRPTSGEVRVAGQALSGLSDDQLTKVRRDSIGFIFQFFNLLPMLTAAENIRLPLRLAGEKVDGAWMAELTAKVGLTDRLGHRPAELSGGQQQRVAVARALVGKRVGDTFAFQRGDDHVEYEVLEIRYE